jgi:DNA-binding transcriptional ArsR family regulator
VGALQPGYSTSRLKSSKLIGMSPSAASAPKKIPIDTPLRAEITLSFANPATLVRVLSPERRRVLEVAREKPRGVMQLARRLKRDRRAVSRDVDLLEKQGLIVDQPYDSNPGHGMLRVVRPVAARIKLVVTV